MADAARVQPHEHLAGTRLGELQLVDCECGADPFQDGGADLQDSAPIAGRSPGGAFCSSRSSSTE